MTANGQSPLWALTSFYNPAQYRRRLQNYRIFRQQLKIPLVTVELGYGHAFELARCDADVLVQLPGAAVMWQKERLLNIALSRVPRDVPFVAWLDCDVLFERSDWDKRAIELLQTRHLVQLFERMYDLGRDSSYSGDLRKAADPSGFSVASLVDSGSWHLEDFRPPTTKRLRRCLFGLAWAGWRSLLDRHGFYDAMIIGSGDRSTACAGYGRFEDAIHTSCMDERRAAHYLEWARPFHNDVQGNMGVIDGNLLHLWHGDIADRKYVERHRDFSTLDFDPYTDIGLDEHSCWQWLTQKPALHHYVKDYFFSRKEDGDTLTSAAGTL